MKVTNDQIKSIHTLMPLNVKTDPCQKALVVSQFTQNPNLGSTKDLTFDQANELIAHYGGNPHKFENWAFFNFISSKHRFIYSLTMQIGWVVFNTHNNKNVVDIQRLSNWLKSNKSPVCKRLQDMTPQECSKTIKALESILIKAL